MTENKAQSVLFEERQALDDARMPAPSPTVRPWDSSAERGRRITDRLLLRNAVCPQCRFEFLAQFVLEGDAVGTGEVQDELTWLLVTSLDCHHDLDSATPAFRGHDANEIEGIRILPNHVEADGANLLMSQQRLRFSTGSCHGFTDRGDRRVYTGPLADV
jgi:hypothetical protein